ncbi:sulfur carrier protein ThiS [Ectobacillus polymachus]|uniref:sulfur carrier protein ThiS n=1 Tax=Ectobacillus polymachus TaxID=1508806 RepID=UPI003A83AD67
MKLKINGKELSVPDDVTSVEKLLTHLGLEKKIVVVEKNGVIIEKEKHVEESVNDSDQIEIITFVGGG